MDNKSGASVQENYRKTTEGHVRRMKKEHIVRRMLDVDIPEKRRRGRRNRRWNDACKRDMIRAGLKEDNATNRAEWRTKLISYTGDPR